jgi:GNAT superfamily N-acetyltransferase
MRAHLLPGVRRIARAHNFASDFPNAEVATGLLSMLLGSKGFYAIVAELGGRVVGSNFVDERGAIRAMGPITIDPEVQDEGIGGSLMRAALTRTHQNGAAGVRLVQAGYHCRSLSLYSKLGFEVREHLCCLQGPALIRETPGYRVRPDVIHPARSTTAAVP